MSTLPFAQRCHHVYEIKAEPGAAALGFVWFASVPRGDSRVAFVFQLFIYPPYRRRGHGREALLQVESMVAEMGFGAIALNVFGSNLPAQALYRSLGYAVTSVGMQKPLPPSGVA